MVDLGKERRFEFVSPSTQRYFFWRDTHSSPTNVTSGNEKGKKKAEKNIVMFTRPDREKRVAENKNCTTQQNMTHFLFLGDFILLIHLLWCETKFKNYKLIAASEKTCQ